ncbi:hypothetical protein MAR_029096 [Mya arenaria]|uniref:Uncharacterized protein n=1 Tax=Mya arenaria TaxID=6604 RepID=A0ABY7DFG0_MYAAR|nr:uncharacterized protein LOC128224869 [Mya arenaria]WAQ96406.1 hypothetical protein MAR_029096 [Mya arenaria]
MKLNVLLVCVILGLVGRSWQQDAEDRGCDIDIGIHSGFNEISEDSEAGSGHDGSGTLIPEGCSEGEITWHYPRGTINVTFTRTALGDQARNRRVALKVCLTDGIGDGVTAIRDVGRRRGGPLEDEQTENGENWACAEPSRRRVTISFVADGEMFYMKSYFYKVEASTVGGHGGGRNGGGRQGGRNRGGRRGGRNRGGGRGGLRRRNNRNRERQNGHEEVDTDPRRPVHLPARGINRPRPVLEPQTMD